MTRDPYCQMEYRGVEYDCYVVPTLDGTPIAVKRTGPKSNPPMVIANGVGVPWFGMHQIIQDLSRNYCVYTWDYRGIGDSIPVIKQDFTIERHASDGLRVMEWFGLDKVDMVGWSMGVPVMLEMYHQRPSGFRRMAFLFGAPGVPFISSMGKIGDFLFTSVLKGALSHPLFPIILKKFITKHLDEFIFLITKIGFVTSRADKEIFEKNVKAVLKASTLFYGSTLIELGKYDAGEILGTIGIKCFVAGGGKDTVTPAKIMEKMAVDLPNATYHSFPKASHFGVIEEKEELLSPLRSFFLSE
jgi:3-oxoadipate enol-lactonase